MKVAVTYEKETGNVFQHFGKTEFFKIYEIADGKIISSQVIDNGGFSETEDREQLMQLPPPALKKSQALQVLLMKLQKNLQRVNSKATLTQSVITIKDI